jgi:hypothetical protein
MSEDQADDCAALVCELITLADRMQADECAESEGGGDGEE